MKNKQGREQDMPKTGKEKNHLPEKTAERKKPNTPYAETMHTFVMPGGVQLSLFLRDWKGIE